MAVAAASRDLAAAGVARLLSMGFAPPVGDWADEAGALALALLGDPAAAPLHEPPAAVAAALPRSLDELADVATEYHRLFGGTVLCPPYEGSYAPDPFQQSRQMADVAGFYRAFGADAAGPAAERPDHIGCQLEFLAYLMVNRLQAEAAGREDEVAVCAGAEQGFLRDHLGRWLGPFCLEVQRQAHGDLYPALAALGQRFAVDELDRRHLHADPLVARRIRTVVEGDEIVCGTDPGACPLTEE